MGVDNIGHNNIYRKLSPKVQLPEVKPLIDIPVVGGQTWRLLEIILLHFTFSLNFSHMESAGEKTCGKYDSADTDDGLSFTTKYPQEVRSNVDLTEMQLRIEALELENQRLRDENACLKHLSERQLETFASMVHELRTPLNCIVGLTDLILLEDSSGNSSHCSDIPNKNAFPLGPEQREAAQLIASSCDLLRSVVDDVLDFSKLEHGAIEVKQQPTNVQNVVKTVVDSCAAHASQTRDLTIDARFDTDIPQSVITDSRLLSQVMFNLIGNAIKFSPRGGRIDVHVFVQETTLSETSESQCHVNTKMMYISVKDYGEGIKKEHIKRIFQPFQQCIRHDPCSDIDESIRNEETQKLSQINRGTGLGLSIACKIVAHLGGVLTADSELGSWSEFVVALPYDEFAAIQPYEAGVDGLLHTPYEVPSQTTVTTGDGGLDVPNDSDSLRKFSVLIVEDNLINQKVLQRVLQKIGMLDIDLVDNGRKAVDITLTKQYDVIFMDIEMPVLDGFEATKLIVSRHASHQTSTTSVARNAVQKNDTIDNPLSQKTPAIRHKPKIVFLSAHASESFKGKFLEVGGDGFITKPFHLPQIRSIFESMNKYNP